MTRTEIWLRLMHVSELYGDAMLSIANLLIQQRQIDKTLLQNAGLTSRQAERFLTVPQKRWMTRSTGLSNLITI